MEASDGGSADAANLAKVDHIVMVMLENRSFDHLLGYLSLTGRRPEIDGLRPGPGQRVSGAQLPGAPPCDDGCGDGSRSFLGRDRPAGRRREDERLVASAAASLAGRDGDPGCVMGYYDRAEVPVYDHLAEEFAVCHRWFSSVPGATLPNRLYALCGVAAGDHRLAVGAGAISIPPTG